jgi:hypothetical protein
VIEEAKRNSIIDAVRLAQKYFPSEFEANAGEVRKVMMALVLMNGPTAVAQKFNVSLCLLKPAKY